MPSVHSVPRPQKRCNLYFLDGTWCERTPKNGTVIGQLDLMTVNDPYQVKRYVKGVGVSHIRAEKYIGGGTAHGIKAKIYDIYVDMVSNYNETTDELGIIGFSRGAFSALVIASLLDLAGIPRSHGDEATSDLFNKFWNNELEDPAASRAAKDKYNCVDVPINFLGCFEAVGALGVPHTGALKVLDAIPRCVRSLEFNNTILPSNVLVFRHALALNEYRGPFTPTLMHIPSDSLRDFLQVWFTGSHNDLGIYIPAGAGLVNIALSWMISEMYHVNFPIRFNNKVLTESFPRLLNPASPVTLNHTAAIHSTYTFAYKATGYKIRVPGSFGLAGLKTNERIHSSVRHRVTESDPVIPGHYPERVPEEDPNTANETYVWKKRPGSFGRNGTFVADNRGWGHRSACMDRTDLKEAEKRDDERRFLG